MTVSIDLPDDALARLRAEAIRRGVSIDTVIAELADQLPADTGPRRRLSFAGTLAAEPELAERSEDILDEIARRAAG
jgi:ABC-type branched-subunit amino acid transport system ATPase component